MRQILSLRFNGMVPTEIAAATDTNRRRVQRYLTSVGVGGLPRLQREQQMVLPVRTVRHLRVLAEELGMAPRDLVSAIIQQQFEGGAADARTRLERFRPDRT
jgi:hypothetical protein